MSVRVMSWVWADSKADGADLLVLLAIADQSHDDGAGAWPSVSTLAARARVSERTVQRSLRHLVEIHELEITPNAGRHGVNIYRVLMGQPPTQSHPDTESPRQADTPTLTPEGVTPVTPRGDTHVTRTIKNHQRTIKEPSTSEPAPRADIEAICTRLADRIEANGSKRPRIGKRWREAARLLLDRDGRTESQVLTAIDWCQSDEFWRSNILSMPKLREKYDQLRLAAARAAPNGRRPSTTDQRVRDGLALADQLDRKALA